VGIHRVEEGELQEKPREAGCIVLDGWPSGEPLGFGGGANGDARWRRMWEIRDGAVPASGGAGWVAPRLGR
jgi:hypothetical protein